MNLFFILFISLSSSLFASSAPATEETLSLDRYLEEVKTSHQGLLASELTRQGGQERSNEGGLTLSPFFFASAQHTHDERPTLSGPIYGDKTLSDAFTFGFSKLFDFGLQSRLYYTVTNTGIFGADPAYITQPQFYANGLTLELTQSLWKNFLGKSTRATVDALNSEAKALNFNQAFEVKSILADAESKYWRLALAQETVRVQEESLERTKTIRDFYARRVRLQLADRADLLQSEAALKERDLNLQTALDSERVAKRAFNASRNLDSDEVSEHLPPPAPTELNALTIPERMEKREDVKAAEETVHASVAQDQISKDQYLPDLQLVFVGSTNGRDPNFQPTWDQSLTSAHPYTSVSLQLNIPLNVGGVSAVRSGYEKEMQGAQLTYERRLFDQENDWKDLVQKFNESKRRLLISLDLEKAQLSKLQQEKRRRSQGQSTTYQVFLFEQDFLSAQLSRIQTEAQILDLSSMMKTYRGNL